MLKKVLFALSLVALIALTPSCGSKTTKEAAKATAAAEAKKAEEEAAKKKAEEEAKMKAEEEAKKAAEAKKKAEAEAKKAAEAKKKAEEEAKKAAEAKKKAEEEAKKAKIEAKKKAEEEAKRKIKEEKMEAERAKAEAAAKKKREAKTKLDNSVKDYKTKLKAQDYKGALTAWEYAYKNGKEGSKNTYIEGAQIYQNLAEQETSAQKKKAYVDKMFEVYDARAKKFDEDGVVTCRKAVSYKNIFPDDKKKYYELIQSCVEKEKNNTPYYAVSGYYNSKVAELKDEKDPAKQLAELEKTYKMVSAINKYNIDNKSENAAKYQKVQTSIDSNMKKTKSIAEQKIKQMEMEKKAKAKAEAEAKAAAEAAKKAAATKAAVGDAVTQPMKPGMTTPTGEPMNKMSKEEADAARAVAELKTCTDVKKYFGPKFKANNKDPKLAKQYLDELRRKKCESDPIFPSVSEKLFQLQPTAELAQTLASYYSGKKDTRNTMRFYEEYVKLETDKEKKVNMLMYLASLERAKAQDLTPEIAKSAREYARQAIAAKPNHGPAYMFIANLYASSGKLCGTGKGWDSQTVTWAAVDMWEKALNDPTTKAEAQKQIDGYKAYFPLKAEGAEKSVQPGSSYKIDCWIDDNTTARFRD